MGEGKFDKDEEAEAKEAAGDLTDDDDLENEGNRQAQRRIGDKVDKATDKVKDAVNRDR